MIKKKSMLLLLLAMCIMILSSCSNTEANSTEETNVQENNIEESAHTQETEETNPIEILESGYSMSEDFYMRYGFKYINNSNKSAFEFPRVMITAYDSNGDVLATEEQVMNKIQPGEIQAFGSVMSCNGQDPAKVEFVAESGNKMEPSENAIKSSDLEISGLNDRKDEYGGISITGKVKNNSSNDTTSVGITLLLKQGEQVIYGSTTYVDNLNSGSEKPFEMNEYNVPEYDDYEVIAHDWGF